MRCSTLSGGNGLRKNPTNGRLVPTRHAMKASDHDSLVHHLFEHDMLVTHAKHRQPVISFAELLLPLPASRKLWLAPDAVTWQSLYADVHSECTVVDLSLHHVSAEEDLPLHLFNGYDKALLVGMKLCAIAAQVWDYQQMRSLSSGHSTSSDPSSELWTQARLQKLYFTSKQIYLDHY